MQYNPSLPHKFPLRGVGPQIAKHLARLNIHSVQDLLFHFPIRYQDRTQITPIRQLIPEEEAVIAGTISQIALPKGGRTKLLCTLQDETGTIALRFFHVLSFQRSIFKPGTQLRCFGSMRFGPQGREMMHPEIQVMKEGEAPVIEPYLTPIYAATEGLSQHMLRKLMTNALEWLEKQDFLPELLPAAVTQILNRDLMLKEALHFMHRPPRETIISDLADNKTCAQQRLAFEELLAHRVSLLQLKYTLQTQKSWSCVADGELVQTFLAQLPFQLTAAQQRVIAEITQDLQRAIPMLRLVQGDVGSGKTVIAALAALQAVASGWQAALMAPTELLAEQHQRVLSQWFAPLGVRVVLLSGSSKNKKVLSDIADGAANIIVGTHALFQEQVNFAKLALIIIDEQHRFGVEQRALLRAKGMSDMYPHQLAMTATPIPRTLAMSLYADLDCSVIDELPPGRTPITTVVLDSARRDEIIARVREACQQGRQVYWVCALIEESATVKYQAVEKIAQQLASSLQKFTVGLIHGRMSAADKAAVMSAFQQGKIQLLAATTVIEVGVDVPNASIMVIENAERLGLAQLHQLRGRVGRGTVASYCLLLYQQPLSALAKARLAVMRETTDGFKIAQRDLELRGPGNMLGIKQTGELSFRMTDLARDSHLLPIVQQAAELMMHESPAVIMSLIRRWLAEEISSSR